MGTVVSNYQAAKDIYASVGVDADKAIRILKKVPVSMHCWQGDDVGGFEDAGGALTGGIQVTGNYPGKARTIGELKADIAKALSLIPGRKKLSLHAIYGDFDGKKADRDAIEPKHFATWVDFAKTVGAGLDFNPTFFSHPKSAQATLSSADEGIRGFWVDHGIASRAICAYMGKELGSPCVMNTWIPDGSKEVPADMIGPRERLVRSLDEMYAKDYPDALMRDAFESKLFGIGLESYTVASNEFCLAYALRSGKMVTFDTGHFHPTESVADKLPAIMCFSKETLLHLSRPVRWDSDHVVLMGDEVTAIMRAIVRGGFLDRVHIALDYFDGTINRVAAWVIGMRAVSKSLLAALLEPVELIKKAEEQGDYTARLAIAEEAKSFPLGAVWDYYCETCGVPVRDGWLSDVKRYEADVLSGR